MSFSSQLVEQASAVLTTAFVAGLWQGTVLMLLAAALLRLMPRASAGLRHTLLLASFAVALVLPWVRISGAHTGVAAVSHAIPVASWAASVVALAWVAAAGTRSLQLLLAWKHLRDVRRGASPVVIDGTDSFSAGRRHARLYVSSAVDSPTILGFWKPALLLPEWMAPMLHAGDLRQIALHECEHLRRRDDWINLLLQLGLVLSPLNPGLLWLNRRIGVQRELACDAAVVASTGEPIAYATCLTQLAEQRLRQRSQLRLALAAWERKSELAQRVHALLQQQARWTARQSGVASAAAAALLLASSVGLARAPRFIRIASNPASARAVVAAYEAPVQIVSPASATLIGTRNSAPAHMVQAVFTVKPVPTAPRKTAAKRRSAAKHKPASQNAAAVQAGRPHMLRVSTDGSSCAAFAYAVSTDSATAPVRLVTADFTTPYVAVPVANGWLLFEL